MLKKLDTYSNLSDLNSPTINQNWRSGKSQDGRRRITYCYDAKIFPDLSMLCDDIIEEVKQSVKIPTKLIHELDNTEWQREDERR